MANSNPLQLSIELPTIKFQEIEGVAMGVLRDGTAYLTERGLARFCGVHPSTINEIALDWAAEPSKPRITKIKSILQREGGFDNYPYRKTTQNGIEINAYPDTVCLAILEYYAFESQPSTEAAKNNFRILARKTLRDLIYEKLHFDPNSLKLESWKHYHDRVLLNKLPAGYFSVFREIADIIVASIEHNLIIDEHTVPDISVGQRWAKHWKDNDLKSLYGERKLYAHEYPEYFPQSRANTEANIYPLAALGVFRIWLESEYLPKHFPTYLSGKIKQGLIPQNTSGQLLIATKK